MIDDVDAVKNDDGDNMMMIKGTYRNFRACIDTFDISTSAS
jgi:hypothetical protein